ncbi:hypothetical protein GGH95_001542 [Coemansia sp. RSA 1836]|nr:hypothetical protein GGH95_001542 [Coemansia sp. RSA 1836]
MEGCNNAPSALPLPGAVTASIAATDTTTTPTAAEVRARVAMHIANTLALRPDATTAADSKAWPADKDGASALCPISRATDYIWQLGLQHPASGLVPSSDYDKVLVLHFVGLWTTRVLPLLLLAEPGGLSSADLAMLSKCILARRRSLKQRGPFWNGRSLSIAEVVVAPFADDILHAGLLPDTREFGPLCTWLAAVRASPVVSKATA